MENESTKAIENMKTFDKYLLQRFGGKLIFRIADDIVYVYKIRLGVIDIVDCFLAWNKKHEYSKPLRNYMQKHGYTSENILSQNTYLEMVNSLKNDYHFSEFEKSDKQFPEELFIPKSLM